MKRSVFVLACMLIGTATATAQERSLKSSEGRAVFVIDDNRQEWQGRLVKVSAEALEVESDAGVRTFKLAEIRRVDADGDRVWDGALKASAAGAFLGMLAVAGGGPAWAIATNALSFGVLGLAIDGACSSRHPVYHAPAAPSAATSPRKDSASMRVSLRLSW
jgi:hypothetical protein